MSKTITQKITFKNTTPAALFNLYMKAAEHTKVTGAKAEITAKEGAKFTAYYDYITGENLKIIKDTLIVQSWRGSDWDEKEADSTFMLFFEPKGENAVLHVLHANLPDEHAESIDKGWHDFYWKPWKKHLSGK